MNVHYADTDILTIFNSLVYIGQVYGLNATSLMQFGKPLHDVTEQEAADLAVLVGVPSLRSNPIRFEQVRDHFLARYHPYVASR